MPAKPDAIDVLNHDYLDMRSRLLDLAAALDRIDRAAAPASATADPRMGRITQALILLADGHTDRAERVQRLFSLPYEEGWLARWRGANSE